MRADSEREVIAVELAERPREVARCALQLRTMTPPGRANAGHPPILPGRRRPRPARRSDRCSRAPTATHRPPSLGARMIGTSAWVILARWKMAVAPETLW